MGELDDDEESFGERKQRWAREASANISTKTFWRDLYICHVSRGPITDLLYWFQKVAPDKSHMVTFVCEKAKRIRDSWDHLLGTPLEQCNEWIPLMQLEDGICKDEWCSDAVASCLEMHADYCRRFYNMATTFPALLLWLVETSQ